MASGIGPEPVRGAEFYGDPDDDEDEEVLPGTGGGGVCAGEKSEGKKDECGDGAQARERCGAGAESVDEENQKNNYAQQPAGRGAD